MDERCGCPIERVFELEYRNLRGGLDEVKSRVQRLETAAARGVMLLVANLAAVIAVLAQQLVNL